MRSVWKFIMVTRAEPSGRTISWRTQPCSSWRYRPHASARFGMLIRTSAQNATHSWGERGACRSWRGNDAPEAARQTIKAIARNIGTPTRERTATIADCIRDWRAQHNPRMDNRLIVRPGRNDSPSTQQIRAR
jgi:hypothetical protein